MTRNQSSQVIYPTLRYQDARAAIDFLVGALGFHEVSVMDNPDGTIGHAEIAYGDAVLMVSSRREETSPFDTGKACLYLAIDDPDAHHDKAVAASAKIVMQLTDQDHGSREYAVEDPEGNVWVFGTYRPARTT